MDKSRGNKRRRFRPPLKEHGSVADHNLTDTVTSSNSQAGDHTQRACHTVLSYCEELGETEECTNTQPLSMFSGERVRDTQEIGESDDPLFPLDDPFSVSHFSEHSKLDDPISKLDDPFSLTGDSPLAGEVDTDTAHEQRVPASPVASRLSEDEEEMCVESDKGGTEVVPRRQFKAWSSSRRHYNLDLLPKHYRKGSRKTVPARARGRPSVNWARDISAVMRSEEREMAADGVRPSLGVFEVPLSAEDSGKRDRRDSAGNTSRRNRSTLDLSICTRTKEQQV